MTNRFVWGVLLLGVAFGCSETNEPNDAGQNMGGGGSAHFAGSSGAGVAGEDDETPGSAGGAGSAAGELNVGGDTGVGEGGVASVHFWTDETRAISLECFGFHVGSATFRADRSELSAAQLSLLSSQTGTPGSTYDGNDDQIHCVVTTTDAQERQRQFTIGERSDLIELGANLGAGGAAGGAGEFAASVLVLGCEFRHPWSVDRPFSASPFCLWEIWLDAKGSTFLLDLASADKRYHVELLNCESESLAGTTVELFGVDPETPLAIGAMPDDPAPGQSCFVLDVQVAAKVVGRLVISSAGPVGPRIGQMIFR